MPDKIKSEPSANVHNSIISGANARYLPRYAKLIANSYDGVMLMNKDLRIIYGSPSAERITGWSATERIRFNMAGLVHDGDKEQVATVLEKLLSSSGEPIKCTFRALHASGHYQWLECTFTNYLDDEDIDAIVWNFRNVLKQKENKNDIAASGHFIQTVTDNLPVFIAYWKADLHCLFANKSYAEWFGKKPEEMIGLNKKSLLAGREYAECADYIYAVLKGVPQNFERTFVRDDGKKIDTYTQYLPDAEGGKVKGFYSLISDVTEIKRAQTEIGKKNEQMADILDNIADGFIALDNELCYTHANRRAGEMVGLAPEYLIGKNIWEVFPGAVGSATYRAIETAFNEKKYVCNEDHYEPLGLWQENRVYPTRNGILMFIRDITEKKELERLLDEANRLARIGGWEVDLEKKTVYWSDITREIHEAEVGYQPDIEAAINFYLEGENRQTIVKIMESAARDGVPGDIELQLVTARGNTIWVRVIVRAEFKDDQCVRLYGSIQDIDERKKAGLALSAILKEKETILESIDDAFFAMDKDWVVTYWNKKAEQISGHSKDSVIGRSLWDTYPELKGSDYEKGYRQAAETQKAVRFEAYYPQMDRWHELSIYPSETGLSVYFRVINERKEAELRMRQLNESLQKQTKELAKSNAELEQFAYVASHDLQEPLRMVTSFLSQLEKKYGDVVDDKGRQYIYFAVDGAKRMRQIILDLLDFSRVGRTEDDLEEVDLNKLVEEIEGLYHRQIEELRAIIRFKDLPVLMTIKTPVRQVFQNLIGNSLKYHSTGRRPRITITSRETAGLVEIAVKDNGIGIAQEYFEKIFVIFQRLHNKVQYPGTGMGLAIAKKIIENLGGKIWVESEEGKGSTFYFTLLKNNL